MNWIISRGGFHPRLAVISSSSGGLMKGVGIIRAFTRNSIWARQKTIYLYPAIVTLAAPKPAHAAAIRPALSEVGTTGLDGQVWIQNRVSGPIGAKCCNRQQIKHLHVLRRF